MSAVPYTSGFLFRFAVFLVCNLILTQLDEIWKTTSIFWKMEDDLIFCKTEDDLHFVKMVDNLDFFLHRRRPHFLEIEYDLNF